MEEALTAAAAAALLNVSIEYVDRIVAEGRLAMRSDGTIDRSVLTEYKRARDARRLADLSDLTRLSTALRKFVISLLFDPGIAFAIAM